MRIFEISSFYAVAVRFLRTTKTRIQEIWCFKKCHICMKMELAMWFLTLSIKTVNMITVCESLHELIRIFSFQIMWLQIKIVYFWFTFDSTRVHYINLVNSKKFSLDRSELGNPLSQFAVLAMWTYFKYKLKTDYQIPAINHNYLLMYIK